MRPFKPEQLNKKLRASKFFENFIQQKGPNGVSRASVLEIQKGLKSFFLDLAYGAIAQEKYIGFLVGDPRVLEEAIKEAYSQIIECTILMRSMEAAGSTANPISQLPQFSEVYNKYNMKGQTYSIIHDGLLGFKNSGDVGYIIGISTRLNSYVMKGSKQTLLL